MPRNESLHVFGLARYSSEGLVQGNHGDIHIFFRFSATASLGLQLRPFGIEQLEKINHSFAVAQTSDVRGALALARLNRSI